MDVIEEIRKHLSIFKNMYDQIRVVDPNSKEAVLFDDSTEISREKCNALWENESYCENCISLRAYQQMDTLFKIEQRNENIALITATPTVIQGTTYVVELIKEFIVPSNQSNENLPRTEVNQLIVEINKKVMDGISGVNKLLDKSIV